MSPTGDRRAAGTLEAEVLATLWSRDEPMTPHDVLAALDRDLAYTTVLTTLTRLHDKGLVERAPAGRAYAYSPLVNEADLVASRMQAALETGSDRTAVLAKFVSALDSSDKSALRGLLKRRPR